MGTSCEVPPRGGTSGRKQNRVKIAAGAERNYPRNGRRNIYRKRETRNAEGNAFVFCSEVVVETTCDTKKPSISARVPIGTPLAQKRGCRHNYFGWAGWQEFSTTTTDHNSTIVGF